jgi:exonuclease III
LPNLQRVSHLFLILLIYNHYAPGIGCKKIEVFARFPSEYIRPIFEEDRLTVRHLALPGRTDILLAVTHFHSKLHWSDASQVAACSELATSLISAERQVGHQRTILVGDVNMNPFEDGIVNANGLHAVMSKAIARKQTRVIQSKEYLFFYNPMWSLFGDASRGPAGTYYYNAPEHKNFFWNMFDQVMMRPDLIDRFDNERLIIADTDGKETLLSKQGVPNTKLYSDHLPIIFNLDL